MKKSGFLISSLTVAGMVANSTLASNNYKSDKNWEPEGWIKDFLERDQNFLFAGHSSHRSHGSHSSHGSHRSSSGGITVPRSSNSTTPTNPLPSFRKPSPTQKVPQLQIMKVQAYLSGLNLYRGNVDGLDGPLTREAVIKYQLRFGLSATGIVDNRLLRQMGVQ